MSDQYNHADSKVTDLISLRYCHEFILNESSIMFIEIQVNLYEPMTSVSSSNFYKIVSLIYMDHCVILHVNVGVFASLHELSIEMFIYVCYTIIFIQTI